MKTTIRDVAAAAGVSIGTVSRVLNGTAIVSDENRDRVDRVVRSLNYSPLRKRRPKLKAGGLQGKRIAIIGLGMDRSLTSLSVIGEAIHAVESALFESDARLELIDLPRLQQIPVSLKEGSVDGLILFGALQGNMTLAAKPALMSRLSQVPLVWLQRRPEGFWGDSVGPNDTLIGTLASQHLLAKGHRRLAFISSRNNHVSWRDRELSFIWHAQSAGAQVKSLLGEDEASSDFPLRCSHDPAVLEGLVKKFMQLTPRPTAIFLPADSMAPYVYRALAAHGLEVGKDISVLACNREDIYTDTLQPRLATFDVHARAMGTRAVDQLALRLRQPSPVDPTVHLSIEPTFMEGESVITI